MTSTPYETRTLRVALLGCGVVGTEVARLLIRDADELAQRVGAPLELVGIAVRRARADRETPFDPALLTTDAMGLVTRGDIDVVIEVIGGIEPARSLILAALESGASVVTANKALLAEDGATLFEAAEKAERDLYYEAAVAGAIPIVRPLRESLAGDRVRARAGHRQRHHQLHPRRDDHHRAGLRRGARRGAAARLRRGRPHRRRGGLRRRRPRPRSSRASPSTRA